MMRLKNITLVTSEASFGGTSRLWRLGFLAAFIGLVLYVIGYSTERWAYLEDELYDSVSGSLVNAHFGLWRKCTKITNGTIVLMDKCENMDNDDDYKPVAKVLCSIGLIFDVVGLVTAFLAGCYYHNRMLNAASMILVCGATVSAVGAAVMVGKAKDNDDRFVIDYSSVFALVGPVLMIVGGGLQLLSIKAGYVTLA